MAPVPGLITRLLRARWIETPVDGTATLEKRASPTLNPGQGSTPPEDFHNAGILALFAIIGCAMVLASIWFFFWAKNGGFHYRKGDWDEYKSTVLRRKGPDGRTLSNATKSTKLGDGTIAGTQRYAWQKHLARSAIGRDEKGRKGIRAKRGWGGTHSVTYSDDALTATRGTRTVVTDEMTELRSEPGDLAPHNHNNEPTHHSKRYRDRDVTAYKKEKPARVGGLNRVADGSAFDSSVVSASERSDLLSESSEQPILSRQQRNTSAAQPQPSSKRDSTRRPHRSEMPGGYHPTAGHETTDDESDAAHPRGDRARAERRAREEAKKMERRWKAEASAAAEALARENVRGVPAARARGYERAATGDGVEGSEVGSGPAGRSVSGSYYDSYRPSPQQQREVKSAGKKKSGGGYRRGGMDSDFE